MTTTTAAAKTAAVTTTAGATTIVGATTTAAATAEHQTVHDNRKQSFLALLSLEVGNFEHCLSRDRL